MSFTQLQVRYQTARSLPAPYAYFYTLTARPAANGSVALDLSITYPDRDDIDDDELAAEGFTRDDDFSWSGRLPDAWRQALVALVDKTRLQPIDEDALGEDDEFWAMHVETDRQPAQVGRPRNPDDWQYLMQELIQATYESNQREQPFTLTYVEQGGRTGDYELRLTASFANRTVQALTIQDRRERTRTLPWPTLQTVMSEVYAHDYDSDEAQPKRPQRAGQWLNLGTDEWHDVSAFRTLTRTLRSL